MSSTPVIEHSTVTPDAKVTDSEHSNPVVDAIAKPEQITKPEVSGVFTVDSTGKVSLDYLYDGGYYQGELAIFSTKGMEHLQPGTPAFIQEAANRALSNSELGHVMISDALEGARFDGNLGEKSLNAGTYQGAKTISMTPGDEFAVMLVPHGKVQEVFDNPKIGGAKSPLFSISTSNEKFAQMVDVTGKGHTFAFEDLRIDRADRDYNDIIFQVNGANTKAVDMDNVIDPAKDWRNLEVGKTILEYADLSANQATFDNVIDQVNTDLVPQVDDVLQQLNTQLQEIIAKPDSIAIESDPTIEQQADADIAQLESELDSAIAELTNDPLGDIDGLAGKYNFAKEAQPLLGIIDTGFVGNNPDIDYGRIILGSDRIDNDNNPLLSATEADAEHGIKILEIIAAKQNNNIGLGK